MERRVVLLRAVNVGGATLAMAELREIATGLGARDVATYIASGNLICTPPDDAEAFDRGLEKAIEQRYGFRREVISRSRADLESALADHPFEVHNDKFSHIYFLQTAPAADHVESFGGRTFGDDEFRVIGADLHIRYDAGAGKSQLTAAAIARGLGVAGTGRNLRTVRKLIDLAA